MLCSEDSSIPIVCYVVRTVVYPVVCYVVRTVVYPVVCYVVRTVVYPVVCYVVRTVVYPVVCYVVRTVVYPVVCYVVRTVVYPVVSYVVRTILLYLIVNTKSELLSILRIPQQLLSQHSLCWNHQTHFVPGKLQQMKRECRPTTSESLSLPTLLRFARN